MKRLLPILVLVLSLAFPVSAGSAQHKTQDKAAEKLRSAIQNLNTPYTQTIDTEYDLDRFTETFDFSACFSWQYSGAYTSGGLRLTWEFVWFDDYAVLTAYKNPALVRKLNARHKALYDQCKAFVETLTPDMTDYDKALAIHDYIALNCIYDSEAAEKQDTSDRDLFTAYGALVEGRAVCQGYAEAASLLLNMVGIENYRPESENHVWNLLKLDDGYYHMDVTWDSILVEKTGLPQYAYMNLTDGQMSRYDQHNWQNRDALPKAESNTYHYYTRNGLTASTSAEVKEIVKDAYTAGKPSVTLWVTNHTVYPYDWERELGFLFNLRVNGRVLESYSPIAPNTERDTLTVIFNDKK